MTIILVIVALLGYAALCLPVYLLFILSFLFRAPPWRPLKIVLRVTPVFAILVLAARTRPPRPDFGDDVAGNIRGSEYYFTHEFWPEVAWIWGAGLSCLFLAFVVGFIMSRQQRHRETITGIGLSSDVSTRCAYSSS